MTPSTTHRIVTGLIAALLPTLLPPSYVHAAKIEQTTFADEVDVGEAQLRLVNVGLMRYRLVFKPFVAALYLGHGVRAPQAMADVPKRLEIEYYYNLKGKDIADAADKLLAANVSPAQLAAVRERADRMQGLYQDVKPGDRYALTYVPGIGTELAMNGRSLGLIEGADFAAVYFTIWLGSAPMDESLKTQLLSP